MRAIIPLTPRHTGSKSVHADSSEAVLPGMLRWMSHAEIHQAAKSWVKRLQSRESPSPVACLPSHVKAKWQFAYPMSCTQQHAGVNKMHMNWMDFSPGYIFPAPCNQEFTPLQGEQLDSHIMVLGAFLPIKDVAVSPVCSCLSDSTNPLLMSPPRMLQSAYPSHRLE